LVVASLGCLGLLLASSCGGSPSGSASSGRLEKTHLVIGAVQVESSSPLYLAQERGIFAAHGLSVTIKPIISTADIVPQLLNGTYDVVSGQITTFIAAEGQGAGQFRVLASGIALGPGVDQLMALKSSQIASAGQLAGKVIAVNAATGNGKLLTDNLLGTYDIFPSQVTYKVIPFAQMGAALASGEVDAAYAAEPWCTTMAQQIGAVDIGDLDQGASQGFLIGGYTATASWVKKYPRTAAAFTASIEEAAQVSDSDPAAIQEAFRVSLKVSEQVASVMATGQFPIGVSGARLTQIADLMIQFGELSPQANVATITNSLAAGT
jgi:NitT/TauT family transport system substrate-binding protein